MQLCNIALRFIVPRQGRPGQSGSWSLEFENVCICWIVGQMARVFISHHNLYEPTYLLNVLAVVLTANAMPNATTTA